MPKPKAPPPLPVIFRKVDNDVTAFFPTEVWGYQTMPCYAHVGQHGGASFGWYNVTRAASPDEYADLLAELRRIYEQGDDPVRLVVYQRMTKGHREAFNRAHRRLY